MGKRFSNLEDTYNTLVAANFDFSTLPATNKYRKYAEWKQDPEKRKLPEGSAQDQGARVRVGLRPFGMTFDDNSKVLVGMSGRTSAAFANIGTSALFNLVTAAADLVGYKKEVGFQPAKAILATKLSSSTAVAASENRITGRAYKKRTGETYTVPFGRSSATSTEFEEQDLILAERAATHAVTFTPEKLSRR